MPAEQQITSFLAAYDETVCRHAMALRRLLLAKLPGITEQLDLPAKMIAYCYGQRYVDMVCVLIPSKKGLKLGFYKGVDLPDPDHLLQGKGKISRYTEIRTAHQIKSPALNTLLKHALAAYYERMAAKK